MKITKLLLVFLVISCASIPAAISAKKALLVTHYGSSDEKTCALTIDRITGDMSAAFPFIEVREAYISPIVRKNLANRGHEIDSPEKALLKLAVEGFDTVYVQSTTIIDGFEMSEVRKAAKMATPWFSCIEVGEPLLNNPADCKKLIDILALYPKDADEAIIYVGHGNMLSSTATYAQLDYMMAEMGLEGYHVSTIEGYPTSQSTIRQLRKEDSVKKVTLLPLLLVCGNHTHNDIAVDFATDISNAGLQPQTIKRGLAEVDEVRALYVEKARDLMEGRNR